MPIDGNAIMLSDNSKAGDTCIRELVPGIINDAERKSFASLNRHQSELKNEELFFRVMEKGS